MCPIEPYLRKNRIKDNSSEALYRIYYVMNKFIFHLFKQLFKCSLFFTGVLLFSSCTRNVSSTTRIELASSPGVQAVTNPRVLIVNVTGPNMQRMVYSWECNQDECTSANLPSSIELEVPRGSQRLFQIIIADEDPTLNSIKFSYDDKTVNLSEATLAMSLAPANISVGGAKFDFAGRYSVDGSTFYTGLVDMTYTPPGKPAMVIESEYVFAGWFKLFGVDGANFNYIKRSTGEALFSNVNLASFNGSIIPGEYVKVEKPEYYYDADDVTVGVQCSAIPSAIEYSIVGFFGNSGYTTSKSVQYSTIDYNYSFMWQEGSCTTPSTWSYTGTAPEIHPVFSSANATAISTPCSTGEFETCLRYNSEGIHAYNQDEFNIQGPFRTYPGIDPGVVYADVYTSSSILHLEYTFLPGINSSMVTGVDYFLNQDTNTTDIRLENAKCSTLPSTGYNLVTSSLTITPTVNAAGDFYSATLASPTPGSPGSFTVGIMCPYKTEAGVKKYYDQYAIYGYKIN